MSTRTQSPTSPLAGVTKLPQQGRSRASYERMLAAARELMIERGNEDFTLQEVSQTGNVSIGSIYLRFDGKDSLVRAVIARELERLEADEDAMIAAVLADSPNLASFMAHFVDAYGEVLRRHAPLLRLTMERAVYDPLVSASGKQSAFRSQAAACEAMLRFANEFGGVEPGVKANAAYLIVFATLARELSLGSSGESAYGSNWVSLKRELGTMCLAYLKTGD